MRLLVGIDDTDAIDSDHGTGRVSRMLGAQLADDHGLDWVGSVRQQFLVDPRVPYTTHNSAACLVFEADAPPIDRIVDDAGMFLEEIMADVADPGLCVAPAGDVPDEVTDWGHRAQDSVVEKAQAYEVAEAAGVFLDEYGGTGDGVIGALGAVGLTANGEDGRFIAYGNIREYGEQVSVSQLRNDGIAVVDEDGDPVEEGTVNTHDWIRPQLRGGQPMLPVEPDESDAETMKPTNLN
ncbi:hypothetical protein [Haloarchaeobius sp. HME9146]|uniref:hypothetical protein n=1 Tax=Haloarchaeobius sp. HME9146 TaxID=2978732 RepID=UPI0021BE1FD3|nr:hypothetical protein [Haloarchaeobius sp. HME9146]MCT9098262.1 hypothetical protein [Haloarchaeobius sp. HME9146]